MGTGQGPRASGTPQASTAVGALFDKPQPNMRMKLSARGGRLKEKAQTELLS
jgi:hypothetical protein